MWPYEIVLLRPTEGPGVTQPVAVSVSVSAPSDCWVCSPAGGHLGCLQCLAVSEKAAVNVHVQVVCEHQVFLWDKCPGAVAGLHI